MVVEAHQVSEVTENRKLAREQRPAAKALLEKKHCYPVKAEVLLSSAEPEVRSLLDYVAENADLYDTPPVDNSFGNKKLQDRVALALQACLHQLDFPEDPRVAVSKKPKKNRSKSADAVLLFDRSLDEEAKAAYKVAMAAVREQRKTQAALRSRSARDLPRRGNDNNRRSPGPRGNFRSRNRGDRSRNRGDRSNRRENRRDGGGDRDRRYDDRDRRFDDRDRRVDAGSTRDRRYNDDRDRRNDDRDRRNDREERGTNDRRGGDRDRNFDRRGDRDRNFDRRGDRENRNAEGRREDRDRNFDRQNNDRRGREQADNRREQPKDNQQVKPEISKMVTSSQVTSSAQQQQQKPPTVDKNRLQDGNDKKEEMIKNTTMLAMKTQVKATTAEGKPKPTSFKPPNLSNVRKKRQVIVHFIRHGEGLHNVAQREWRNRRNFGVNRNEKWDGVSEPYTIDNDPQYVFLDAKLTNTGKQQAMDLQFLLHAWCTEMTKLNVRNSPQKDNPELRVLKPPFIEKVLTSPMRRAAETAVIAIGRVINFEKTTVKMVECLHELGGRHTCDKRLDYLDLRMFWDTNADEYLNLDSLEATGGGLKKRRMLDPYANEEEEKEVLLAMKEQKKQIKRKLKMDFWDVINTRQDPLWDEKRRETWESCAMRCATLVREIESFVLERDNRRLFKTPKSHVDKNKIEHIVVASHSAFLLTLFNTVFQYDNDQEEERACSWFGTGEMRSVLLTFPDILPPGK
ncbi:unnamed protein product [Amoebophrya sp. A120]|nr:unnamed protein product [Amoebophrya sp. A120]|eukprot:GSA120T00015971001.1